MKIRQKMNRREFVRLLSLTGLVGGFKPLSVFAKSYNDTTSWDPFVANITYIRRAENIMR